MIKGTSQNVIEIKDTQNIYYDRAILFLKPEYADKSRSFLETQAKIIIQSAGKPSYIKYKKPFSRTLFKAILYVSIIASILTSLLMITNNSIRI